MPADPNIFQQYLQAPKSVTDYTAMYDQADARKNALAQSVQALQQGQMALTNAADVARQRSALRDAISSGQIDLSNPSHTAAALSLAPDVAPAMLKTVQDSATSRALASKDTALAGKATADTAGATLDQQIKAHDYHLQQLGAVNDPASAKAWAVAGLKSGVFTPEQFAQGFTNIPTDPAQFAQWKQQAMQGGVSATEQLKMTQAKQIADNQNATSRSNNAATNATSTANNRATIAGENMRAGVSTDGTVSPDVEAQAQAIAKGQLLPPSGAALINPKNARVLARVMEINPNYDATTVLAKKKAATDFTTGPLGNSMRSFAVAGQHLDQLGQLADALDNGNIQLVNKIGNTIGAQTGSPAPTNFDAAKDVVSKEVVKAIVAGGGGVAEREELSKLMSNAKSPAQLKGVIQQYRSLMAAQHDALLQQRRAAGLPDSTLPSYTDASGSPGATAAPAGWGIQRVN